MLSTLSKTRTVLSERSHTIKVVGALAGGNLISMVLGMAGSIIQARYIGPIDMGLFKSFSIITSYLTLLHIGTFDGIHREFPYLIGKGERARAESLAAASLAWLLLVSGACSVCFLVLASMALWRGDGKACCGWITQAIAIWPILYGGYLSATYRTGHDFSRLSVSGVVQGVVSTAVLPLLPYWGYYAMCLRSVGGTLTGLGFLHHFRPLRIRPVVHIANLCSIVRIGLPLFAVGYVETSLWAATESLLVLKLLGARALGLFALVVLVRDSLTILPGALNQVYAPRVAEEFGRSQDLGRCVKMCIRPTLLSVIAMGVVAFSCTAIIPSIVGIVLPAYTDAVPSMVSAVWNLPVAALSLPMNVLFAYGSGYRYGLGAAVGFVVFVVSALLALHYGYGLTGVVVASLAGRLTRVASSYYVLHRL